MNIPCLSLTQPWATLVAIGAKCIETRSWSTGYRGPLVIHAAKQMPASAKALVTARHLTGLRNRIGEVLRDSGIGLPDLPLGAVVAIATLQDCKATSTLGFGAFGIQRVASAWVSGLSFEEMAFGDYRAGRFGWFLSGPLLRLPHPIPARGMQRLWQWECPDSVWAQYQEEPVDGVYMR